MSLGSLQFPGRDAIKQHFDAQSIFQDAYFEDKGLTEIIIRLAVERFADKKMSETEVKVAAMLLVSDLEVGKDIYSGTPLADFKDLKSAPLFWTLLRGLVEPTLLECAKKV